MSIPKDDEVHTYYKPFWIWFGLSLLAWWFGWYVSATWLFIISLIVSDAHAIDEQEEWWRKRKEEDFARLYPEKYAEQKREEENLRIEREKEEKEAAELAYLKECERKRQVIQDFENWCLNKKL